MRVGSLGRGNLARGIAVGLLPACGGWLSAAPRQATPADALPDSIGANVHAWYPNGPYTDWNRVVQVVGDLKIRQVRDHWNSVEKFNQLYDATGAKVSAIMQYNPPGIGPYPPDALYTSRIPQAISDLKAMKGLGWIEGPNEYDAWGGATWHQDLLAWQSQLYTAAKADNALKNIPEIAPSIQAGSAPDITPYWDAGNLHYYQFPDQVPSNGLDYWLNRYATDASTLPAPRPVYITESGYHTAVNTSNPLPGVDETTQAKLINRTVFDAFNAGARKTFLYELIESYNEPALTDREAHFGIVRADYSYKPAAQSIRNLNLLLSDQGPAFTPEAADLTITGGSADLHSTLLQKRDGTFWLALWNEVPSWDTSSKSEIANPDLPVTINWGQMMDTAVYRPTLTGGAMSAAGGVFSSRVGVPDDVLLVSAAPVGCAWNASGGGVWSAAGNWTHGVPDKNVGLPKAVFGAAAAAACTVTLDAGHVVGHMVFDNPHGYTLAGSSLLQFSAPGNAVIEVLQGSHAIRLPLSITSPLVTRVAEGGALSLSGSTIGTWAGLIKEGAGSLSVDQLHPAALNVNAGTLTVLPGAAGSGASRVGNLDVADGAKLDLTNNKLITTTPAGSFTAAGVYDGVTGLIQSGRNGGAQGAWSGSGIVTSSASGNVTTLGIARASQVIPSSATATALWAGETVSGSDTLVMYTYAGDANLDGTINVDDYGRIDLNVSLGTSGWFNGDFNYDGKINVDDYGIIDFNVGIQGPSFSGAAAPRVAGISAIPEPAGASLVVLASAAAFARRRRKSRART